MEELVATKLREEFDIAFGAFDGAFSESGDHETAIGDVGFHLIENLFEMSGRKNAFAQKFWIGFVVRFDQGHNLRRSVTCASYTASVSMAATGRQSPNRNPRNPKG